MASSLGHEVLPGVPSLFSFRVDAADDLIQLAGVSIASCDAKLVVPPVAGGGADEFTLIKQKGELQLEVAGLYDVKEQLEKFEAAVQEMEDGLTPLLSADRKEMEAALNPLERARVHIALANAVSTLYASE